MDDPNGYVSRQEFRAFKEKLHDAFITMVQLSVLSEEPRAAPAYQEFRRLAEVLRELSVSLSRLGSVFDTMRPAEEPDPPEITYQESLTGTDEEGREQAN